MDIPTVHLDVVRNRHRDLWPPSATRSATALRRADGLKRMSLGLGILFGLSLAGCGTVTADSRAGFHIAQAEPGVLPPQSRPYGKTYGEWAAQWWKWAYSVPFDHHPLLDATGEEAAVGQQGHVWFLGGSFASSAATRHIQVPPGHALFFPILNQGYAEDHRVLSGSQAPISGDIDTPAEASELIRSALALVRDLQVTLDGTLLSDQQLRRYYTESPLITFPIVSGSLAELFNGIAWNSDTTQVDLVDAGYYLMLAPLSVGQHTLHFSGRFDNPPPAEDFALDVIYHIEVVPNGK